MIGCQWSFWFFLEKMSESPIMTKILKIAEPTIVPEPIFSLLLAQKMVKIAKILVKSSGAELPTAINVAPVTSDESFNFSEIFSNAATK